MNVITTSISPPEVAYPLSIILMQTPVVVRDIRGPSRALHVWMLHVACWFMHFAVSRNHVGDDTEIMLEALCVVNCFDSL